MNQHLKYLLPEVHHPATQRIDAILFADFLGITHEDMANLIGCSVADLRWSPSATAILPVLEKLYTSIVGVRDFFEGNMDYVRNWLKEPHWELKNQIPLSFLLENKFEEIHLLIQSMKD